MSIQRSDVELHQDVLREFAWDTRVGETEVGVEVDGGVVTLTGTVDSWAKRVAAEQATHRVVGVLDVANDIRVRVPGTPGHTDTELARAVRQALEWHALVPHERIHCTVTDGVVKLEGAVDTWAQKEDAEQAVQNLTGILGFINDIEVRPRPLDAASVHHAIKEALRRHIDREVSQLRVTTQEGTVKVAGCVQSWPERRAIVGAIRGTRGVEAVDDVELVVMR